jgi:peptidyl-prolyl cis-trans isomerase SurA
MQTYLTPLTQALTRAVAPLAVAAALAAAPLAGQAQGLFSPAYVVNDSVVTNYELEQRILLLQLLRFPGDPVKVARKELIDDRLKEATYKQAGIEVTEEMIKNGIEEFAKRANLSGEEFAGILEQNGVSPQTLRDFITVGLGWREYVASTYLSRARPTDAEIDRAMGQTESGSVQVLLSELIMPITPQNAAQVEEIAQEVAQLTSFDAFSAAATQFSAADSRNNGGRLNWMALSQLPPALRATLLGLAPGEVTPPLSLQNAVALFQLRDLREVAASAPKYAAIEYATYFIPGGRSPEALATAKRISDSIDTCDDLYGIAKDQPAEVLERQSVKPSELPQDIAIELAKLDNNEISTALTRNDGQTLVLLMLCGRTGELAGDATREDITNALTQQRLTAFANSKVAQLRAEAIIVEK